MKAIQRMSRDIEREVESTRHLIGKNALDERVMAAMLEVPRHRFVPSGYQAFAYDNNPVSIGHGQTISQPYMVALMTDLLEPKADDVILEVGTGCGYQAAVLSRLVKQVYTIETIDDLAAQTANRLDRLGYDNIEVRVGDGYYGWPEHAPYDGIIVTAAAPAIPEPLLDQLKVGGRLVIPVGLPYQYQELVVAEKKKDGAIDRHHILAVAFVPMAGKHESPENQSRLEQ